MIGPRQKRVYSGTLAPSGKAFSYKFTCLPQRQVAAETRPL